MAREHVPGEPSHADLRKQAEPSLSNATHVACSMLSVVFVD